MNDTDKPSAPDQQPPPATKDALQKTGNEAVRHMTTGKDLIVVGIGASAGGLDALQRVLPGLPAKAGMAYIIVQHLAPKHRSLLSSLLAKHTEMAVETIRDGMPVRPDTIYITPPNRDVTLSGQRLHLSTPAAIGPRPSVDYFFISLAEEMGARAVGIVLSGTGTDGAHGIRAIKSNDGITMAQSAGTAKFDGMPQAAVNTGLVDLVLPPEDIGPEIENALKYPHLIVKAPDMHADEIGTILEMLHQHTGVDFGDYKPTTIQRRISRRMVIHKLDNLRDYVTYIQSHPEEVAVLKKDLLISVTSFFRDAQAFEALAEHLRELLANKTPGDAFRAWVPGCATGEEAFTIAILVTEILGDDVNKYRPQIFATDLDEEAIQLARKGFYPLATVMETEGRRFEKYFSHHDNTVKIKKKIRDMVVLAQQDLIKDTPFLHLDLISCRNMMIYLNSELQDKLLALFQFSLNPNGLLFLGKSESINKRLDLFKTVDNKWKIYRRKESQSTRFPRLMQNRHMAQLSNHRADLRKRRKTSDQKEAFLFDALLDLLSGCTVLADENANILYIRGDVGSYCRFPQGSIRESLNLLDVARPEIRYVLQSMLHKVGKEKRTLTSNRIALNDGASGVLIRVGPAQIGSATANRLIVFTPVEVPKPAAHSKGPFGDVEYERIRELEQELEVTREHLQDTVEELETSSEELQSLNEELQSANEELQASNEELETSNEELQASNEELNTVNDELRAKSEEANELLAEFKSSEERYRLLVNNMNAALMTCGIEHGPQGQPTDLIIQQANPAMLSLIGIEDHALPLRAGSAGLDELVTEDLLQRFEAIDHGGKPEQFEIRFETLGKDIVLSVYSLNDGRVGMVLRDETEHRQDQEKLKASEANYRDLVQNANSAIIRWKKNGHLTFFNEFAQRFFGYSADEIIGKHVSILLPEQDTSGPEVSGLVADIVAHPERFMNYVNENVCRDGRRVWMTWTNKPILDADGQVTGILAVGSDITERKRMEEALLALKESLEEQVAERTALAENRARQLQALSVELIEAEERERRRVAELLHDDLQQLLASARMQLQHTAADLPPDDRLANVEALLKEAIDQARNLSVELSPPMLNHAGLVPTLTWLGGQMKEQFDLTVHLDVKTPNELGSPPLNVFVFRAIQELLFNVVKHARAKEARVTVGGGRNHMFATVRDDGRGFDTQSVINTTEPKGFGLLSLVERARSIGGSLKIQSNPGRGSFITLIIPYELNTSPTSSTADPATAPREAPDRPPLSSTGTETGLRVLLVDDHQVMRQGLTGLLAGQAGIAVVGEAADGQQAIELARELRPDLIIMDVSMPKMDGIEATRRIKAEMPEIRIIGLSMHEDDQIGILMRKAGAESFLSKSASSAELLKAIAPFPAD